MLVNKELIKELEAEARYKKDELNAVLRRKYAVDDEVILDAIDTKAANIRQRLRGIKRQIEWEKVRYDYLGQDKAKLKELGTLLGKEVQAFRGDKDKPQILLGVYWKDTNDPNYARSGWVALVKYSLGGSFRTSEISINQVKKG